MGQRAAVVALHLAVVLLLADVAWSWYDAKAVSNAVCCFELEHHWRVLRVWTAACAGEFTGEEAERLKRKFVNATVRYALSRHGYGAPGHLSQVSPPMAALCEPGSSPNTVSSSNDGAPVRLSTEALDFYLAYALCQRELPRTASQLVETPLTVFLEADPTHEDELFDLIEASCVAMRKTWQHHARQALGQQLSLRRRARTAGRVLCGCECSVDGPANDVGDL